MLAAVAAVALLQGLFTYAPFMQALFETRALAADMAVQIVLAGAMLLLLLEIEKLLLRRWRGDLDSIRSSQR